MELQFISVSSFPFLSCVLLIFTILLVVKMGKRSNSKLPPGPWKLPLIGNLHQMIGSQLTHHKMRDLAKKYGPLMHLQLGEVSAVVVSSPEIAKQVMKDHDLNFADRPLVLAVEVIFGGTGIVFSPYGDHWRQLRKIATLELLSIRRVQSFRSLREEEMMILVDWISSNAGLPVNLSDKLYSLGYANIARAAFGKKIKEDHHDTFSSVCKEVIEVGPGFYIGDVFPSRKWIQVVTGMRSKLERLHCEADRILTAVIEDHQNKLHQVSDNDTTSDDLVDVHLKFTEHNDLGFSLTLHTVKAVIFDTFIAGSESTATLVGWAMSEMMKNPRTLIKAQTEVRNKFDSTGKVEEGDLSQLSYLQVIIKETLRLHPPLVLLVPRECKNKCEIGGFEIPPKTKVFINAWAIGRDPNYWNEPEKFNPERFLDNPVDYKGKHYEYLPFGAGRRICPGMVYGLTGAEYQLATLLYHFDWELPNNGMKNNEELDMTETFGVTSGRKNDLYLIPTPYQA